MRTNAPYHTPFLKSWVLNMTSCLWNVPLDRLGQLPWLFPLPRSCTHPVYSQWGQRGRQFISKNQYKNYMYSFLSFFPGLAFHLNYNGETMCNFECLHKWKMCTDTFTGRSLYRKIARKVQINVLSYTAYTEDDFILYPV